MNSLRHTKRVKPSPINPDLLKRVVVIGSSCAGKTTFARSLSRLLEAKHIELDAISWLPDWEVRPNEEFREMVQKETSAERWVLDGNYSRSRDIVWPRATSVVWLNYSFPLVLYRVITRTTRRVFTREELFSGNRETFREAFLSKDSMIIWVLRKYHYRRWKYAELVKDERYQHIRFRVFRKPSETEDFLQIVTELQSCG